MRDLAQQVVRDGEGATKFVEINVTGATSDRAAACSRALNSQFAVGENRCCPAKTPIGGRVVMAIGKSGAPADRDLISITFGEVVVAVKGWVSPDYSEEDAAAHMKGENIVISVDLGNWHGSRDGLDLRFDPWLYRDQRGLSIMKILLVSAVALIGCGMGGCFWRNALRGKSMAGLWGISRREDRRR